MIEEPTATASVYEVEKNLASTAVAAFAELGCGGKKTSRPCDDDEGVYAPPNYDSWSSQSENEAGHRKKRQRVAAAYPGCDCEFQYRDFSWRKFTEYEPTRNGVEIKEFYVVNSAGRELFTYAEGIIGNARTDHRFPYLCGEIVSAKKLANAGKLKEVHAWVQMSSDFVDDSSERPLHVQQRQEDIFHKAMTSLPLTVDRRSRVVVFRTHGESLFVQLMPTLRSEHKLIPGTPLFDKNNRGIRAAVGSMFSQYDYVVNCLPTEFCEIPIRKNKHGSDRLRIICLDRRGIGGAEKSATGKKSLASNVLSLVGQAVTEAVIGPSGASTSSGSSGTLPTSVGDPNQADRISLEDSSENELIYNGVVNEKFQITDFFTTDKKNKPPKHVVTVVIDDEGVSVNYTDDTDTTVFKWTNADPTVSYSIMPRRYFNARASVVAINTASAASGKKESSLKRYKSQERLI